MKMRIYFVILLQLIATLFVLKVYDQVSAISETLTCVFDLPDEVDHPRIQPRIKERYALRGKCNAKARD